MKWMTSLEAHYAANFLSFYSATFDYEVTKMVSNVQVFARDSGLSPRSSGDASITVSITNVNDEPPTFNEDIFGKL